MTYQYRKTGFASALALGVAVIGLAGAASASSIHVLTSEGEVLRATTANGNTTSIKTISPLAGTEDNENFSPNSLGFFDGTFYATTFNNAGDEIIYRFNDSTASGEFDVNTVSTGNVNAFAAGDANADGFSIVSGNGTLYNLDQAATSTVSTTSDFTTSPSTFGDIVFDTFNPGVTFASYTSGGFTGLEKFVGGASVDAKSVFDRYVGLAFDEFGQLFGVSNVGGIFSLNFDAGTSSQEISKISLGDGVQLTDAASVTPVPLPAAGWLMLVGFGGLAALRRRKRTA